MPSEHHKLNKWTKEEEKILCDEVMEMGGKIPKWYLRIVELNLFPGRSASSINSQYNHLLRTMSPLIDDEMLNKEKERRDKLKEKQQLRIENSERPPLKQIDPEGYEAWHKLKGTGKRKTKYKYTDNNIIFKRQKQQSLYHREHLGDLLDNGDDMVQKLRAQPEETLSLYRRVYWAKNGTFPIWPCVTVPPIFRFTEEVLNNMEDKAIKSEGNQIFVMWFGEANYSTVSKKLLYQWTPENTTLYMNQNIPDSKKEKLYEACLEAELFRKGYGANKTLKDILSLLGQTGAFQDPVDNKSFYQFNEETRKVPNIAKFRADVDKYLKEETDELAGKIYSWLKSLQHNQTLNKNTIIGKGLATFVTKLCQVKSIRIADFSLSLLQLWNQEFKLFQTDEDNPSFPGLSKPNFMNVKTNTTNSDIK